MCKNRIIFRVLLLFTIGVFFFMSCTQPKVYRIGVLSGLSILAETTQGFKEKMTELGYEEGKNITYDVQETEFDFEEYKRILKKFVDDKVDLIFVFPTEATQEAKAAAGPAGIPVVFANAFTEDTGIINSVREPGGNITGVRWDGPDLAVQRFEILHEMAPNVKRVIIPYLRDYPIVASQLAALRPVAREKGIMIVEIKAFPGPEVESELNKLKIDSSTDSILALAEPLMGMAWNTIGKFAFENNIPIGAGIIADPNADPATNPTAAYDSLFDLIPQDIPQGKQAAILADKVLKGIPAGTIPVLTADNYLRINYKHAQEFGLKVSDALLARANEIVR
jgi:putative ABC transport system substrate-binding protein